MSVLLKGQASAAPKAHIRAFEQAKGRIQVYGLHVRQVWRRRDRQLVARRMGIVAACNDVELAWLATFQPAFAIYHARHFAQG